MAVCEFGDESGAIKQGFTVLNSGKTNKRKVGNIKHAC
jgi:hypothetical protein